MEMEYPAMASDHMQVWAYGELRCGMMAQNLESGQEETCNDQTALAQSLDVSVLVVVQPGAPQQS